MQALLVVQYCATSLPTLDRGFTLSNKWEEHQVSKEHAMAGLVSIAKLSKAKPLAPLAGLLSLHST